jgi:hypothetical protein
MHGSTIATRHVITTSELTAHGAFESLVPWEEACVVKAPHKFHFVLEMSGYKRVVSDEICSISFGCGEEVAM